ncbi:hypothetical protein HMPREF9151_01050 [Hoylesella saccharolytica F0055]|uniref:Uncharacterized protein n=1 Tax=Hoylesella saccharolytica F0055 TaxID=1127699 RepID=L1NDJ2_9BACT|nr:hypothetical protein HMPREF9151_01050 [Hoylesella saccharolytica F0055]
MYDLFSAKIRIKRLKKQKMREKPSFYCPVQDKRCLSLVGVHHL